MQYGVLGSGSFGTAIANLIAENASVYLYTRRQEVVDTIEATQHNRGQKMHPKVVVTTDLQHVCENCNILFPVVPSSAFRNLIQQMSPYLRPDHILIHGTKGLNVVLPDNKQLQIGDALKKENIRTMTEIIAEESNVIRLGCISGPNLSKELAQGKPAATVVSSRFKEVIDLGKAALMSDRFKVYGSYNVLGVEIAGVLKNIMALASGMVGGLELGENAKALLISCGLTEMIKIGDALGADKRAFFGLAGIGDLVATCSSSLSRNYTVGYRLAKGEALEHIIQDMNEVAEGVKTVKIAKGISRQYGIEIPITEALFEVLFQGANINTKISELMMHELDVDAEFMIEQ